MTKTLGKLKLIELADTLTSGEKIEAAQVKPFLDHKFSETSRLSRLMLSLSAWISLFFASVLVIFPEVGEWLIKVLPGIFLLPDRLATGLDYIWGLVGKPVKEQHLMYHLPNIIVYAFGVAGVRQLWRKLHKNNWKDRVLSAQSTLADTISSGTARVSFEPGFSLLLVGAGDQVAKSLVMDDPDIGPTLSVLKPEYTGFWTHFSITQGNQEIRNALDHFNSEQAGEYVLFPVMDDHLFLPGPTDYDLSPHRLEIVVRLIRQHEEACGWDKKRLLIVGDKEQTSRFVTTSQDHTAAPDVEEFSLRTIEREHENISVVDPTEITLQKIIEIADGRRILFRASEQGSEKYNAPLFERLALMGYQPTKDASLTIGYDISDLETEHQVLSRGGDQYLPVILSREIFDLLSKSHLQDGSYIFVPRLVKEELQKRVGES